MFYPTNAISTSVLKGTFRLRFLRNSDWYIWFFAPSLCERFGASRVDGIQLGSISSKSNCSRNIGIRSSLKNARNYLIEHVVLWALKRCAAAPAMNSAWPTHELLLTIWSCGTAITLNGLAQFTERSLKELMPLLTELGKEPKTVLPVSQRFLVSGSRTLCENSG